MGNAVILSFTDEEAVGLTAVELNIRNDILHRYQRFSDELRKAGWDAIVEMEGTLDPSQRVACQRAFQLYRAAAAGIDETLAELSESFDNSSEEPQWRTGSSARSGPSPRCVGQSRRQR